MSVYIVDLRRQSSPRHAVRHRRRRLVLPRTKPTPLHRNATCRHHLGTQTRIRSQDTHITNLMLTRGRHQPSQPLHQRQRMQNQSVVTASQETTKTELDPLCVEDPELRRKNFTLFRDLPIGVERRN
jgi:hypothetical protein